MAAASPQAPANGASASLVTTKPTQHSIIRREKPAVPELYPSLLDVQKRHQPHLYAFPHPRSELNVNRYRLRGTGIEVCVGSPFGMPTWSLPKALISHYSEFLKAGCTRNFKERDENCIRLPEDDSEVFSCFVNWMYYGSYIPPFGVIRSKENFHAKAWVLGDKLLATHFKNYAMAHVHAALKPAEGCDIRPITPTDMRYVCANTTTGSPLRRYYLDVCAAHFSNAKYVQGTTEDWDDVLGDYADARIFLLQASRASLGHGLFVKALENYLQ
ncbi:hypothetical protein K491DRAFT_746068 [Lophiostoma macrostomum CBS 122681]|uniref:BTB domain-containing protein n=1 Tax=Lophiostoma macrostomum CBS 122681 TaxID=1314788 RepID=A0A6A6TAF2_9PLEO|nr:hypothetical protein K491DRAFT_746068 [Lophiostoma macrostomum CBS 122681]